MASTSLVLSTSTWGRWSLGRPPVDLGLLHADMEPFTFHSSLPWHELECAFLMGVHCDHQVISIKKLLWHTGAELTRQRFQQKDGEQWDKVRALTQIPTPNSSLYWPLTRTRLWALWYMPWITRIQFIHIQAPQDPSQGLSWYTIEGFLRVDEGKIEPFISGDDVLLLSWQPVNMASMLPLPRAKANCITSMFIIWRMEKI